MNDTIIKISYAKNRKCMTWRTQTIKWSQMVEKLSHSVATSETLEEFLKMPLEKQGDIKDVGGFVGGSLRDGIRRKSNLEERWLLTLDIDFGKQYTVERIKAVIKNSAVIYSTHKHSPTVPRLRLIMPLSRAVKADEYGAVSRKIAEKIDIELFDPTTYDPVRLMFWGSHPKDQEPIFVHIDEPILNPDEILAEYKDWRDMSEWAVSQQESHKRLIPSNAKQSDPTQKNGVIGAFCRVYSITETIHTFLSDIYKQGISSDRYTYINGSSANGLVIYEDKWAYSNHGTDPASGKLCNAFDLVRIHKYGHLDVNEPLDKATITLPSYKALIDEIQNDEKIKRELSKENQEALNDLKELMNTESNPTSQTVKKLEDPNGWMVKLKRNKWGVIEKSVYNLMLIIKHDNNIKELTRYNVLTESIDLIPNKKLPWKNPLIKNEQFTEEDFAGLFCYISTVYGIDTKDKLNEVIKVDALKRAYHPIKDLIEKETWDGNPRIDTLFIDYLGAEDTEYNRAVARKTLIAAVKRIYEPGCKFDQMTTIVGPQGCGKSTLIRNLGGKYFNDTISDVQGQKAYESLRNSWIVEMGELSAFKKKEREAIKSFISASQDTYRQAFGRYVRTYPRHNIFIGTTNEDDFLKDITGNRRYWIVEVGIQEASKNVHTEMLKEINQIYAEAYHFYKTGETDIYDLGVKVEDVAKDLQKKYLDGAETEEIATFLDLPIPNNWEDLSVKDKRAYLEGGALERQTMLNTYGSKFRDKVMVSDLILEFYRKQIGDPGYKQLKKAVSYSLKQLGWKRQTIRFGEKVVSGFKREVSDFQEIRADEGLLEY